MISFGSERDRLFRTRLSETSLNVAFEFLQVLLSVAGSAATSLKAAEIQQGRGGVPNWPALMFAR
jgi:hypothetical protein